MTRCSSVEGQRSNHQEPKEPRAAAAPVDLRQRDERGSADGEEGAQMKIEGKREQRRRREDLRRVCTSKERVTTVHKGMQIGILCCCC